MNVNWSGSLRSLDIDNLNSLIFEGRSFSLCSVHALDMS